MILEEIFAKNINLTKKFWDTQECLGKILYFVRIELYIHGKCSCRSSF